jgi:hypothetical protein
LCDTHKKLPAREDDAEADGSDKEGESRRVAHVGHVPHLTPDDDGDSDHEESDANPGEKDVHNR